VVDVVGVVALLVLATVALLGAGSWLLGQSRWLALPRVTPLLVDMGEIPVGRTEERVVTIASRSGGRVRSRSLTS